MQLMPRSTRAENEADKELPRSRGTTGEVCGHVETDKEKSLLEGVLRDCLGSKIAENGSTLFLGVGVSTGKKTAKARAAIACLARLTTSLGRTDGKIRLVRDGQVKTLIVPAGGKIAEAERAGLGASLLNEVAVKAGLTIVDLYFGGQDDLAEQWSEPIAITHKRLSQTLGRSVTTPWKCVVLIMWESHRCSPPPNSTGAAKEFGIVMSREPVEASADVEAAAAKPMHEELARVIPAATSTGASSATPGGGLLLEVTRAEAPPRASRVEVEFYSVRNLGGRHENEDRVMSHSDQVQLPDTKLDFHQVGVLDGHDTEAASELVSERLPHEVSRCLKEGDSVLEAYTKSMAALEDQLKSVTSSAGTCVLSCTIADRFLWCANLGDCRSILVPLAVPKPAGAAGAPAAPVLKPEVTDLVWMSQDHKASCPAEKKRIEQAGGRIYNGRVKGLESSRTLGDFDVKAQVSKGVISIVPEVRRYEFVVDGTTPAQGVLICATDGVWDVLTGTDVTNLIVARKEICQLQTAVAAGFETVDRQVLKALAEDLVQFSIAKGSRDDCTAIVALISVPPDGGAVSRQANKLC